MSKTQSKVLLLVVFVMLFVASASAEDITIPSGSKVFVEDMDEGLDGFIRAELIKKKVPLTVVLTPDEADFVLIGEASTRKSSWHEGWLSPNKDNSTGSVMLIRKSTKELVWAEEAGDRSLMWGALARGGPRKVASRIVDRLKKVVGKPQK